MVRLRQQSSKCKLTAVDEQLMDQIIEKCESVELRKIVLTLGDDKISLDKIISVANSLKMVDSKVQSINRLETYERKNSTNLVCPRCGGSHTGESKICPARNKKCLKCEYEGHFRRYCRTRATKRKAPFKIVETPTKKQKFSKPNGVDFIFHLDNDHSMQFRKCGRRNAYRFQKQMQHHKR